MTHETDSDLERRVRSTLHTVAACTSGAETDATLFDYQGPVRRARQPLLAVAAGVVAVIGAASIALFSMSEEPKDDLATSAGRVLIQLDWNGDTRRVVTTADRHDGNCAALEREGFDPWVARWCGGQDQAPSLTPFNPGEGGTRLHFAVVDPEFVAIRLHFADGTTAEESTVPDPADPNWARFALYTVPRSGLERLELIDSNGAAVSWDDNTALADEQSSVPPRCRSSEATAHEAALKGAQLHEIVTAKTLVATLTEIEDALEEPFQHRPDDMQAVMCVFVLQGIRSDSGRDAVTVVVLNPDFPPDSPGGDAGFFFTQTSHGQDVPAWVDRLESLGS
jgi:hypothetical protein